MRHNDRDHIVACGVSLASIAVFAFLMGVFFSFCGVKPSEGPPAPGHSFLGSPLSRAK